MAGWYYAHGETKLGPFSGDRLKELAAAGAILPTDTVWRDGTATGAPASLIKNLFAALPAPVVVAIPPKLEPTKPAERPKRGSAAALKNAEIAGQDGVEARYRMMCKECGTKDASCRTVKISNKTTKANYFCPKCRKRREVIIQCRIG